MKKTLTTLALVAALSITAAACGSDDDPETDGGATTVEGTETSDSVTEETTPGEEVQNSESPEDAATVIEAIKNEADLTTIAAAIEAGELTGALEGEGPFTIFAPTDSAFAGINYDEIEGIANQDELIANKELLVTVLQGHVVAEQLDDESLTAKDGEDLATLSDATITIEKIEGAILVNGVGIIESNSFADNGVVHKIDQVMLPAAE